MEKEKEHKPGNVHHVHHKGPVIPPKHHAERRHAKPRKGMGMVDKAFLLAVFIGAAYVAFISYQQEILELLQRNPYVWAVTSHIFAEVAERTLLGLCYAAFFGSLFFVFVPLEVLFLYYQTIGYPVIALVGLTVIAVWLGLAFDYFFGRLAGMGLMKLILGEGFDKFKKWIERWGSIAVFFFSATPLPIQPVSVVIGAMKFPMKKFMIAALLGLLVKYISLVYLGNYLAQTALPMLISLF